jgi:hypothetical protein
MRWTSLDEAITSVLLKKGYPIHYYLQCLKYACDCLREINFDELALIKSEKILINEYKAIMIPFDYVDIVRIGVGSGQFIQPLVNRRGINRLNNRQDGGAIIKYGNPQGDELLYDSLLSHHNQNGESVGKYYGFNARAIADGYTILKERNEIQLDENINADYVILDYISDGTEINAATHITPYAQATIEAYINWQLKENNRTYNEGEKQRAENTYYHQRRILRARLNEITLDDIKRAVRAGSHGSLKG